MNLRWGLYPALDGLRLNFADVERPQLAGSWFLRISCNSLFAGTNKDTIEADYE